MTFLYRWCLQDELSIMTEAECDILVSPVFSSIFSSVFSSKVSSNSTGKPSSIFSQTPPSESDGSSSTPPTCPLERENLENRIPPIPLPILAAPEENKKTSMHRKKLHFKSREPFLFQKSGLLWHMHYLYKKSYIYIYIYIYTITHIYISNVRTLIAINRIQNKNVCLHNICVLCMFIMYT